MKPSIYQIFIKIGGIFHQFDKIKVYINSSIDNNEISEIFNPKKHTLHRQNRNWGITQN